MPMEDKYKAEVEILGETYTLKGDSDPEHMKQVASIVNETMEKISENNPRLSIHKIAVLAALNIADDYLKGSEDSEVKSEFYSKGDNE